MPKLHLLSSLALTATLLLPGAAALAQDEATGSAEPDAAIAADDPRLQELEALVPPALAGLPLDENLQSATGEELAGVMSPEELAILEDLLMENGKTLQDYAAVATWLPISDQQVVVLQAHRIAGVEASQTIDAWAEILSLSLTDPQVSEGFVGGRTVTLMTDSANEAAPLLHMFPALDVVWMMWADDEVLVEEAMDQVGADEDEGAE